MAQLIPLNVLIPIALVVIILIVVMWYLYTKNRKLSGKLISEKKKFAKYKQGAQNLKNVQGTEKDFKTLNNRARGFFKEYFDLTFSLTYLKLEKKFNELKKPEYAKFCKLMSDLDYKGKKSPEEIKQAIAIYVKMIDTY